VTIQYTKEFRKDAVKDWEEYKDLGINACAKNLGISKSILSTWRKLYESNEGTIPARDRGNYESDAAKENARLKKELRDAQDSVCWNWHWQAEVRQQLLQITTRGLN